VTKRIKSTSDEIYKTTAQIQRKKSMPICRRIG